MDKSIICWNCHAFLKYDSADIRPNIWHKCPDGILTAIRNPNNKEKIYKHTPSILSPHEIELQQKKALNKRLKEIYG